MHDKDSNGRANHAVGPSAWRSTRVATNGGVRGQCTDTVDIKRYRVSIRSLRRLRRKSLNR